MTASALVAASLPRTVQIGKVARIPHGAHAAGPLATDEKMTIGFALRSRDPAGLSSYALGVSSPTSPLYHRYLNTAQFAARFAPSASSVRALTADLERAGFQVGSVPADRMIVPATAPVGTIERALRTHLARYRLASGGLGWAASSPPSLLRSDAAIVSGVVGLDDLVTAHSSQSEVASRSSRGAHGAHAAAPEAPGAPRACRAATSAAATAEGWTQADIAEAYGLTRLYAAGDLAAGQTIGIFELEPFSMADVAAFDKCYFGASHAPSISVQDVDGFNLQGAGSGESILDIEDISALAPDAHIVVYEAPNTTFGTLDQYATIVSQDQANIVSTSWGECESALASAAPGSTQLENSLFEEAAAQGQTLLAASGDDGSDDCANTPFGSERSVQPDLSVDDPGAQPYVISVGGTSLTSDRQPLTATAETVWNGGAHSGAGGGGVSNTWPIPPWQADSGVLGVATSGNREVPDVSAAADPTRGVTVFSAAFAAPPPGHRRTHAPESQAGWTTIGGTSSSAPIWAAVIAEIAASAPAGTSCGGLQVTAGGPDLGFVAPELYAVASAHYAASFNDITTGNNDVFGLGQGYRATEGFNLAAGLGSPIVTDGSAPGLATYLCAVATGTPTPAPSRPVISSISPGVGLTGGGGTMTVTLAAPLAAGEALHAAIGAEPAAVVSIDGTTVQLTIPPAAVTSSAAPFAGAGPAMVTLTVTGPGGSSSSAPSPAADYDYVNESSGSSVPTVTGVGPSGGNIAGGGTVTVYGSGFEPGPLGVTFGGVASSSVQILNDHELRATVPAESAATACSSGAGFDPSNACQVQVVVQGASGSSPQAAILPALSGPIVFNPQGVVVPTPETEVAAAATEYDYGPTPVITNISPNPADASGQAPITILGSGFSLDTFDWVNFGPSTDGQSEQLQIKYLSGTKIEIDPPGSNTRSTITQPGGVSVQTAAGLSNVVTFGYAGVPSVTGLSRRTGPSTGGSVIRISGDNLTGTTSVEFVTSGGGSAFAESSSSDIVRSSSHSVTVVAPAAAPGPVDIEPCTPSGCSRPDPSVDDFVFYSISPPTASSVRPASGSARGGELVTITGHNLAGALAVRFGNVEVTRFVRPNGYPLNSPVAIAVLAPPGKAGTRVRIQVVTRSGRSKSTVLFSYS